MKEPVRLGVIGGSGIYKLPGIENSREMRIRTPFGMPSDRILVGEMAGIRTAFLPRHGRNHTILPTEINVRANVWALKSLGVERVIGLAAVGSLKQELPPRHFVFPDQIADETKGRTSTFFGRGIVAHVAFAHPFCEAMRDVLSATATQINIAHANQGTYICMEGPLFSSRAESEMHRQLGYSVIGMTAVPEAKLLREAEICYANVAMVTDYDCWKEGEEVSLEMVISNLTANGANAQKLVAAALPKLVALERSCPCSKALSAAIVTAPASWPKRTRSELKLLIGKYERRK